MLKKLSQAVSTIRQKKNAPLHIEFNLTDFCNLNCKGCSHFSPVAPQEFEPLKELEDSMAKISGVKNSEIIKTIYLIGGETLLYPWLKEAIVLGRKYFPWADIKIFTNGLLIPKMDEEFWRLCKENDIVIAITRYPVKVDYDAIEALCREKDIKVEIFGDRRVEKSFYRLALDPEKKQNRLLSHFRCISFGCVTVDHGKIFPCSQSACVGHLNKKFGTDFKWEKGDYISVDKLKDAKEIKRLRSRPVPFCGYCMHQQVVDYGLSKRDKKEWIEQPD